MMVQKRLVGLVRAAPCTDRGEPRHERAPLSPAGMG